MMDKESKSSKPGKENVSGELVIPIAAVIFTLYYFLTIIKSPWTAQVSAFFIGAVLITLASILTINRLLLVKRGAAELGIRQLAGSSSLMLRRVGLLILTISFIVTLQWGGFTITTLIFLVTAMTLLSQKRNWKLIIALSATLSIGGYFLFIYGFDVRFPKGPFELMMAQFL